jgi:hypothetical protein
LLCAAAWRECDVTCPQTTMKIVDDLIGHLERGELFKSFANIVQFGAPKAKPIMLDKICDLVLEAGGKSSAAAAAPNPSTVLTLTKFVVPLAFALLDNNKNTDLERGNQRLVAALAQTMGVHALFDPALTSKLTPQQLQKARAWAAS